MSPDSPIALVTGYEPFDEYSVNPSAEIAKELDGQDTGSYVVKGVELPLDYKFVPERIKSLVTSIKPDVILCMGQASRAAISLERLAKNAVNTKREDNYGNKPSTDVIDSDAPAAYFSNLDLAQLVSLLRKNGIPAYISYDAGIYGCNLVLFHVLQMIDRGLHDSKAGFIHVPCMPEQAIENDKMSLPTMPFEMSLRAVRLVLMHL
ncbi:MAG: pyroglutamyl-peptidase I [Candidatus Lokiarchaeota archaeon]|nr:pyroglutamyl-peptidase I [Candidatus Lokiarchaeota archaeon]